MIERESTNHANLDEELFSSIRSDPAPAFDPQVRMADHGLSQRYMWVKKNPPKLGTVLTIEDVMKLFHMPRRSCQRMVKRHLIPLGCVEKRGRKYYVAAWGIRKLVGVTDG